MIELTRKYKTDELEKDINIEIIFRKDNFSLEEVRDEWNSIKNIPTSRQEKVKLRNYLAYSNEVGMIKVKKGKIYIFKWPNNELRCFVTTESGTLIEPYTQSNWYTAYPFIEKINANEIRFENSIFSNKGIIKEKIFLSPSHNFSHFILDSLAPFMQISFCMNNWKELCKMYSLFTFNHMKQWQYEFSNLIEQKKGEIGNIEIKEDFTTFDIMNVYIPIKTNLIDSGHIVRKCIAEKYDNTSVNTNLMPKLIMISRNDSRRARIENISEIEYLVREYGGSIIDASTLSLTEKVKFFSNCQLCIAESSGCINWSIFAPEDSVLVAITDSEILTNPNFTLGGFVYFLGMINRIIYLKGIKTGDVPGSPVGASRYNLEELESILKEKGYRKNES